MSELQFTRDEQQLIDAVAQAPAGAAGRLPHWLAETVPPIALAAFGLYRGRTVYLVVAIAGLVLFNTRRMYRQYRFGQVFRSICLKLRDRQPQ